MHNLGGGVVPMALSIKISINDFMKPCYTLFQVLPSFLENLYKSFLRREIIGQLTTDGGEKLRLHFVSWKTAGVQKLPNWKSKHLKGQLDPP